MNIKEEQDLESLLEDEPECQSSHTGANGRSYPCTIKVIAQKTAQCLNSTFFVCKSSYDRNIYAMETHDVCLGCNRDCNECWEIHLI